MLIGGMMNRPLYTFFFFNDTATTEIYTLSLHDALPISPWIIQASGTISLAGTRVVNFISGGVFVLQGLVKNRSEEHTSELQSQSNLVCRLLLEKKKMRNHSSNHSVKLNRSECEKFVEYL